MTKKMVCLCTALLFTASLGVARADGDSDGTGLDLGRGLNLMNLVLGTNWNNSLEDHRDYVEDFGISSCVGCHEPGLEGYSNGAPGCLTCHGPKFCGERGTRGLAICAGDGDSDAGGELSAGNLLMNLVLGVNWSSPFRQHRDYVEDFGIGSCGGGCHAFDMGGKVAANTFVGPGCLSCHGVEWDGGDGGGGHDGDSDSDSGSD